MIVKSTVYFELEKDEDAVISNVPELVETLSQQLEEFISDSSFKLTGSFWSGTRIKANFVTRAEALEILRTKS